MWKKIFELVKRLIISCFILYGYNLIAAPLNLIIPINVVTVLVLTLLGFPALIGLIVILLIMF